MNQKVVVAFLFLIISTLSFSQKEMSDTLKKQQNEIQISKRDNTKSVEQKKQVVIPVAETKDEVVINPKIKGDQVITNSNTEFPKPATKTNEKIVIPSARYTPNSSETILDNLLAMLDLKNNIDVAPNRLDLKNTSDYKELTSNIVLYRRKFENHIQSNGFENCSLKEQNYFLSFLKDEDRMEEYNAYLSKIK
jgi:hypothetical protein